MLQQYAKEYAGVHILNWPKFESSRRISMFEMNKAVIRSFVDSVNSQNSDRLRILLVPSFIRHSNAAGQRLAAQVVRRVFLRKP
ncbi:MAG: hypothetical protein DMG78_00145 [Acidobacteria bacterium]|nr:MAG: hypothetical protein DMG78_00145 [Acidobacteriota bacterium]